MGNETQKYQLQKRNTCITSVNFWTTRLKCWNIFDIVG